MSSSNRTLRSKLSIVKTLECLSKVIDLDFLRSQYLRWQYSFSILCRNTSILFWSSLFLAYILWNIVGRSIVRWRNLNSLVLRRDMPHRWGCSAIWGSPANWAFASLTYDSKIWIVEVLLWWLRLCWTNLSISSCLNWRLLLSNYFRTKHEFILFILFGRLRHASWTTGTTLTNRYISLFMSFFFNHLEIEDDLLHRTLRWASISRACHVRAWSIRPLGIGILVWTLLLRHWTLNYAT